LAGLVQAFRKPVSSAAPGRRHYICRRRPADRERDRCRDAVDAQGLVVWKFQILVVMVRGWQILPTNLTVVYAVCCLSRRIFRQLCARGLTVAAVPERLCPRRPTVRLHDTRDVGDSEVNEAEIGRRDVVDGDAVDGDTFEHLEHVKLPWIPPTLDLIALAAHEIPFLFP